jgi:hypothetical protein
MAMSESELKTLIQQAHVQPFRVRVDDGRVFTVSHPDFAFVGGGVEMLILVEGHGHNLGGAGMVLLPFSHISGIDLLKKKSKAAA